MKLSEPVSTYIVTVPSLGSTKGIAFCDAHVIVLSRATVDAETIYHEVGHIIYSEYDGDVSPDDVVSACTWFTHSSYQTYDPDECFACAYATACLQPATISCVPVAEEIIKEITNDY